MKTFSTIALIALLFVIAPGPCFAFMEIEQVTKERAKELGIELRTKANGQNEVWVELEFHAKGGLKDFDHVSLEISEDGKSVLGYAPLRPHPSDSGRIYVVFLANRVFLEKVTLRVVTGRLMDYTGHDLRVSDFVDLKQSRSEPSSPSPQPSSRPPR